MRRLGKGRGEKRGTGKGKRSGEALGQGEGSAGGRRRGAYGRPRQGGVVARGQELHKSVSTYSLLSKEPAHTQGGCPSVTFMHHSALALTCVAHAALMRVMLSLPF